VSWRGCAPGTKGADAPAVALIASGALLLGSGLDLLPPDALALNITVGRLLVIAGLVALVAGGARLEDFRTGIDIPIALLLVAAAVTTVRGGHPGAPLRFLLTAVAFFYLTVALLRGDRAARGALILVALVTVVVSGGTGVAQVAQDAHTTYYRDGLTPVVSTAVRPDLLPRAVGSFPNPNLLAGHLLLLGPVAALAGLAAATRAVRVVTWALVALAYLGLVLTFSRAGVVAAAVAGALALVALAPTLRRPLAVVGAAVLLTLGVGGVVTDGALLGGFGRPEAWRLATDVALANPLTGVGLARAGDAMTAAGDGTDTYRHAHNLWLTWWVETGPLGLLAMIWIALWLLAQAAGGAVRGSPYAAGGLAAAAGFFAFSLVDHPANAERIALASWFVAALIAAGRGEGRAEDPGAALGHGRAIGGRRHGPGLRGPGRARTESPAA
jgi:O-antigen ligase